MQKSVTYPVYFKQNVQWFEIKLTLGASKVPTLRFKLPTTLTQTIWDVPDHTTFREKGAKLACANKPGVFLSLTLCNKANFEYLSFVEVPTKKNLNFENILCFDFFFLMNITQGGKHTLHLKNIFENKKFPIKYSQRESLLRPYQGDLMGR